MYDSFNRDINYLRISITDECNLRCLYCMPDGKAQASRDILSKDEICEIVRAAAGIGISKVRITGGEPLMRSDAVGICREASSIPGIKEVTLTTNGVLLEGCAKDLKKAGVKRVNISLDTLDAGRFRKITRGGCLDDVLRGISAALEARLTPVKVNAVLIGGFNTDEIEALSRLTLHHEIELRFIELMPMGTYSGISPEAFVNGDVVLKALGNLRPLPESGVARMYALEGAKGRIGIISPVSRHFCFTCNRIRITSDGYIKPCLHSSEEIPLRGLHGQKLKEVLREAVLKKPAQHVRLEHGYVSEAGRSMNRIGG